MPYYVYILLCEDGSFYTGYAKNVEYRFSQHKNGRGARYTRICRPEKIVYMEKFNSLSEAMRRERRIKAFTHSQKQQLVNLNEHTKEIE